MYKKYKKGILFFFQEIKIKVTNEKSSVLQIQVKNNKSISMMVTLVGFKFYVS